MLKLDRTGLKHTIFFLFPMLLLIQTAVAQSGTGNISGTVEDQSGLPVEGAEVFVYGSDIRDITSVDGSYLLSDVECGSPRHIVCAVRDGSITAFEGRIDVPAGGTVSTDLVLTDLEESNSRRSQYLYVKMGYIIDFMVVNSDTLQPDENAVLDPSLYPDSVTVYLLPGEHIDPADPLIASIANDILMSIPEPLRTNQTEVARKVYIWVVTHIHYDLQKNYPGDITCGAWQTNNGGWGLNFNDWSYEPSEVVEEERAICVEFERLTSSLLRALDIPARPFPVQQCHPVTQWWVQLSDGSGYWANMETSGGSTEYWENGDSLACFPARPEHKLTFCWPNSDAPIHMNWESGFDHIWKENTTMRSLQRNPGNLALAMMMLDEFEQYGAMFTSGPTPEEGEPFYKVYAKGFSIDLGSMETGEEIIVWFPLFPANTYREVLDTATWTSHPEWVTDQWVETVYDPTSGRSLDLQYISFNLECPSELPIDLLNCGFEEGGALPSNWTQTANPPGSAVFDKSGTSHSGSWSAHITGLQPVTNAAFEQSLAVEPGQHVRLNGWLKRDLLTDANTGYACYEILFTGSGIPGGSLFSSLIIVHRNNEQGWIWLNGGETVPAGADSVTIRCSVHGLVEAWFDDIQLSIWESSSTGMETEEWLSGSSSAVYPVLHQNYPNPFNSTTMISFTTVESIAGTELVIYNISGRIVKTLVNSVLPAGEHSVSWDGTDENGHPVGSGIYFCHLISGNNPSESRRMVLLK